MACLLKEYQDYLAGLGFIFRSHLILPFEKFEKWERESSPSNGRGRLESQG